MGTVKLGTVAQSCLSSLMAHHRHQDGKAQAQILEVVLQNKRTFLHWRENLFKSLINPL